MKSRLLLLAALLPAIAAYAILFRYAFSAPYQDDYHAIVEFSADYQQQPDWKQKLLTIAASQHNEYKLAFEHVIVAADLELTHHLDFLLLVILGDLTLVAMALLLWKIYGDLGLLAFLPIPFLLFALTYWETLDWAMTGLQNVPVILFSLLACYFLARALESTTSQLPIALACISAAVASLTSANGFLLAPIGLFPLLTRRRYKQALLWCLTFVVPLAAYLYRFTPVQHPVTQPGLGARPFFFFAVLGGILPVPRLCALLGVCVFAVVLYALRSRYDRTHPAAAYFVVWIVGTAALIGWVRGAATDFVASRYSIYALLLLIFCYAFLTRHLATRCSPFARRAFYAAWLIFAIALCVAADRHAYQKLAERRHMVLAGIEAYCADPAHNSPLTDPRILRAAPGESAYEQRMLTQAIHLGVLTSPCVGPRHDR